MSLEEEIAKHSATVSTTSYSMSVGELIAMYRDHELDIHPEFQRFFRWTLEQKSRFIESLLLGIPIPPIFVSERNDSKWDVIDGLQRLSTILQLTGELRGSDDQPVPPLELTRTKYLKCLEGMRWAASPGQTDEFPELARIKIKRARLDVNIVKNTSDEIAKYEIFQRLNSGGSNATDQEVRNCILVMNSPEYFDWISNLSKLPEFRECIPLTDRAIEEAFDVELVVRFIVLMYSEIEPLRSISELGSFLTDSCLAFASDATFDRVKVGKSFGETFRYLNEHLGENAFRRFDPVKAKYLGSMLIPLFEVVATGLGRRCFTGHSLPDPKAFLDRHKQVWSSPELSPYVGSGIRASTRIPRTVDYGRKWLVP
jgi:Protein of unknown function DUF262